MDVLAFSQVALARRAARRDLMRYGILQAKVAGALQEALGALVIDDKKAAANHLAIAANAHSEVIGLINKWLNEDEQASA